MNLPEKHYEGTNVREIHISGHAVATAQQFLADRPEEFHCLVITDPGYPFPEEIRGWSKDILHLSFHDACFPADCFDLADLAAVRTAITWAEGRDKLLVACHAGISRSSAFAYVIGCLDRQPEQALEIIDAARHRPNDLVVKLGSKALGNDRIWEVFLDWCRAYQIGDSQYRLRFIEEWGTKLDDA
ncbi:MAG: hypothetical protein K2R98_22845 [Gemmataceae bacterium]|nr:hypothetical protein [Gemmataceae bacterium]